MGRRGGTMRYGCVHDGCREARHVGYDSQREGRELAANSYYKNWRCAKHANPERYLTPENPANSAVLVATDLYRDDLRGERVAYGRFWIAEGKTTGSGLDTSGAHYAMAEHFPVGTRLVITAYTETPEQAAIAQAADEAVS